MFTHQYIHMYTFPQHIHACIACIYFHTYVCISSSLTTNSLQDLKIRNIHIHGLDVYVYIHTYVNISTAHRRIHYIHTHSYAAHTRIHYLHTHSYTCMCILFPQNQLSPRSAQTSKYHIYVFHSTYIHILQVCIYIHPYEFVSTTHTCIYYMHTYTHIHIYVIFPQNQFSPRSEHKFIHHTFKFRNTYMHAFCACIYIRNTSTYFRNRYIPTLHTYICIHTNVYTSAILCFQNSCIQLCF